MNSPCLTCEVRDECQPYGAEYTSPDGIFHKEMRVPFAFTQIPQHSHEYGHTSYLVKGSVEIEGRIFRAPYPIHIPAHKKHTFLTLEDDTMVLCIHNVAQTGGVVAIHEEHIPHGRAL